MLIWMSSCSPDSQVAPRTENAPEVGAFGNVGNDNHPQPTAPCGAGMKVALVDANGDSLYDFNQLPFGEVQLLNDDTIVWLGLVLNPALFTDLGTWYVGSATNAPIDQNGDFDLENFPNQSTFPYANVWSWATDATQYGLCNDWITYFEVFQASFFGGPNEATRQGIWAGGSSAANGYTFNYCKDLCAPVCDTVKVTNPGYNPGYGCPQQGGNFCNKRIRAKFDNCTNSVKVRSNTRLRRVTLLFDDCTTQSFNTGRRTRGNYQGTGVNAGKTITGIFVRNGCNNDCWLGEFISQTGETLSQLGCTCPPRQGC